MMASWKVAPALAAGCAVVLKPAEQTPLRRCGWASSRSRPASRRASSTSITGDGATGAALVDHPGVDKISFTGSTAVGPRDRREGGPRAEARDARAGRQVAQRHPAGRRPEGGARRLVPGHLLQRRPGLQRRLAPVRAQGPVRRGGRGARGARAEDEDGPGSRSRDPARPARVRRAARARHRLHREGQGRGRGAGRRRGRARPGYFVEPTLFTTTSDDIAITREEIFGPVLVALPYDSVEEVAGARTTPSTGSRPACGRAT